MSYTSYKHLLGRPYTSGENDCYGLVRNYYRDLFGIEIINAARPEGWWNEPDINLIDDFMEMDGWEQLGKNTRSLKVGDGLVFSLINGKANHVGVYVGNGAFIHHIWNRFSCEDALLEKWKARLLMIVRHPEVAKLGVGMIPTTDLSSMLPEKYRAKLV
jgi:cell wall-associated NlpC family hydrolase